MINKIKKYLSFFFQFDWMSRNFFIRIYLCIFICILYLRIAQTNADPVDNNLVGIVVAQVVGLLTLKTGEKIFCRRKQEAHDEQQPTKL